jgi:PRTRC genetic system protein A
VTALDPRDTLLQSHTPAIMVPRYGELPPMDIYKSGHRYLVAEDGLWLELRRPWLHARTPWAAAARPMPYGKVEALVQYAFSQEALHDAYARFVDDAYAAMPNECAGWGVYSERTGALDYRALIALDASPGGVTFHRPLLADHEHLAVDLHSHGAGAAFFSETDDADDAGEVKISVVVGTLDREPTFATRLCLLGEFIE